MSDKQTAIEFLQRLPDNVDLTNIKNEIEFVAAIREGEAQADCGEVVPHEQVKKEFQSWITK